MPVAEHLEAITRFYFEFHEDVGEGYLAQIHDLLTVLVRESGSVVTRDDLMREVWGAEWWGSTKTLDMHMSWLRRKLGDDAAAPRMIFTEPGIGYRFASAE